MAVERWKAPKTVTALRAFLGFATYPQLEAEQLQAFVNVKKALQRGKKAPGGEP